MAVGRGGEEGLEWDSGEGIDQQTPQPAPQSLAVWFIFVSPALVRTCSSLGSANTCWMNECELLLEGEKGQRKSRKR